MTAFPVQLFPDKTVARALPNEQRLWSVTTILKALASPGLDYWGKEQVAKAFIASAGSLQQRIAEEGEEEVIKWGLKAPYRKPIGQRSAADYGTDLHAIIEHVAVYGKYPEFDDELAPAVEQLDRWLQRAQPEFLAAEMPCYNLTSGYAGTCDGMMKLQGVPLIWDLKTSKETYDRQGKHRAPYPEAGLQLSAYRHAEYAVPVRPRRWEERSRRYYLFGDPEKDLAIDMPPVDGGMVLHLTPGHCNAHWMRCDEEIFECFQYVLEVCRWENDVSKTVVGDIIQFEEV